MKGLAVPNRYASLVVLSGLLGALGCATAQTSAPRTAPAASALVGTWKLVSFENWDEAGKVIYEFGEHPVGYIVYDSTGHVFVNIMRTPALPATGFESGSPSQDLKGQAYDGYAGYFGTYSVDWAKKEVVHHVEGSLDPSYTGTDQPRPFSLNGDTLILGDQKTWKRVLVRLPDSRE